MALGSSVHKMVLDVGSFIDGTVATRKELTLQRQLLESVKPEVEKYGDAFDALRNQLMKGLVTIEQHNELMRDLRATLPENVDAEQKLAAALKEGEAGRRALMTETEKLAEAEAKYADAKRAVVQLQRDNIVSDERAGELLAELRANSPAVLKAIRDQQEAEKQLANQKPILAEAVDEVTEAERRNADLRERGLALNREFMPATEQARLKLVDLKAAYAAGHVTQESYRNGLIQLTATQLTGIPIVGRMASTIASVGPAGVIATAAAATVGVGFKLISEAASFATDKVTEQIGKIDKLVEASDTVGIAVDQYQRMAHAADLANISQSEFSGGTEKMLVNISKAADGSPKIKAVFDDILKLNAKQLRDAQPDQAFNTIVEAIDRIPNSADKARAATAIFGSADFLRIDTSHIKEANTLMDRLRANMDKQDASIFGEFDANVKNMNAALDVTWQKVAMEIVPALGDAAEVATEWLIDLNQNQTFTETLQTIGDSLTVIVATGREVPGVIQGWMPVLERAASLFRGVSMVMGSPAMRALFSDASLAGDFVTGMASSAIAGETSRGRGLDAQLAVKNKSDKPFIPDDNDVDSVSGMTKELEKQVAQLQEAAKFAGKTKEEIILLKLAEAGASDAIRESASASVARIQEYERAEKATKEAEKAREDSARKAEQEAKQRADNLQGTLDGLEEEERKLRLSERAYLVYDLTMKGADATQKAAALAHFDSAKALAKEADARKLAKDTIKDMEKELRQVGMTPDQKKLDDLKQAGVNNEELKKVDSLQKELQLRKNIHDVQQASLDVIKMGSREEFEVLERQRRRAMLATGSPINSGAPIGPGLVGGTATASPPRPTITGAAGNASVPPKPMIAPQANESLREQQKTNALIQKLIDKPEVVTIEEVTLS